MDKKEFVSYVDKINDYMKKERAVNDALRALSPDFGGFCMGEVLGDMTSLLAKTVGDVEWLDYYVWETECGTNDCADSVYDKDGEHIPFKTPEDVYNLIMEDKLDEKDDDITNYLLEERDKYKKLYENERDHSETLQRIIDKTMDVIVDDAIPDEARKVKDKTTTSSGISVSDELIDTIIDEILKEFGSNE